jgi:xanthine dehydrogenase accessory factor
MGSRHTHLECNDRLREVGSWSRNWPGCTRRSASTSVLVPRGDRLSIAAEIVAGPCGGSGVPLKGAHTPIHHEGDGASNGMIISVA